MIDKENIELFKRWASEGSICIDEYTNLFMFGGYVGQGQSEFYRIAPELSGFFKPDDFEDKESYVFCYGQQQINKRGTIRFTAIPAKVYKLKALSYFEYDQHQNNLLSAISFTSFHCRNNDEIGIPHINYPLRIAQILSGTGDQNDQALLKAAVLQCLIKRSNVCIESIEMLFGEQVKKIISSLAYINRAGEGDSVEDLLTMLNEVDSGTKQVQLSILIANLYSVTELHDSKRKAYLSWSDQMVAVCKSASSKLFDLYMVERSMFN
jgi:hypothetical protein